MKTKSREIKKKVGRPSVIDKAYKVRSICLDDDTVEFLKAYGEGNISEGIREMVKTMTKGRNKKKEM